VQASGDITLNFGIQHEIDFEVRDNYDLDNGLTDGCARAPRTGNDCSGAVIDSDGFVEQETRLIVQGSQGDIWKARVTLEREIEWGAGFDSGPLGMERGWADVKLYDTPVHVKAGLWWDQLDPFRLVWSDDEVGIKVYATHGNISWAVWWAKEDETTNSTNVEQGRDGDQDYYMARVTLDFGSFQVSPAFGYVRNHNTVNDSRFATGLASVDAFGSGVHNFRTCTANRGWAAVGDANVDGCAVDEDVLYPGIIAKGNFGPVSFVGEVFGAFGEIGDDSAVDAQRNQDVAAFLVAADVGVKLGAWTPHAGIIYASGDDNPHDDDAESFISIGADNENLLGQRGIAMDDAVPVLGFADDSIDGNNTGTAARLYGL
ncbi:MAG: hypothetical protein GTO22_25735, partial [Gemmatimonadales bacterium]|nr:hypothetical protein [Gemmatimonadales bacterium]